MNKKSIRKYSLTDPKQEIDEKEAWLKETPERKLHLLEVLRRMWIKLNSQQEEHGGLAGFRRVFRIIKQT